MLHQGLKLYIVCFPREWVSEYHPHYWSCRHHYWNHVNRYKRRVCFLRGGEHGPVSSPAVCTDISGRQSLQLDQAGG